MAARGLHDGASQPIDGRYLFTHRDRQQVMQEWKDEFHALPEQMEQQKRDSWKPENRPVGGGWGRNKQAVRNGKHSRFARHLQLEAGSKTMAELIIYAGRFDPEFLNKAHETPDRQCRLQAEPEVRQQLKRAAATAKLTYRKTCLLRRRVDNGDVGFRDLADWEQENLTLLENGTMLRRTNHAVAAYGHGTLRHGDESIENGGSTGGVTRLLLDGYAEPDVYSFLARR